jgi:uncharacterized small protein (DUF1192 family)
MTIVTLKLPKESTASSLDSGLEGEQAAQLYVAEIGCRINALDRQIGRLQAALAERKRLLDEIEPE